MALRKAHSPSMRCRLPAQSDPLNLPLEELQGGLAVETLPTRASAAHSHASSAFGGASAPLPPPYIKRRSSTEIMRGLPEKLRAHAEHAQARCLDSVACSLIRYDCSLLRSA
jgi:hypothetical protein